MGTARRILFVTFSRSENRARMRAIIPQDSSENRRLSYQPNSAFYRIPVQGTLRIVVTMVFLTSTQPCDSFR